jgi:hypothetical protein
MTAWVPTTPDWVDYPSTTTAIDAVDLDNFNAGLLATNEQPVVLFYNGTTYVTAAGSTAAKTATGKPKVFVGAVDPRTLTGGNACTVVSGHDLWGQP